MLPTLIANYFTVDHSVKLIYHFSPIFATIQVSCWVTTNGCNRILAIIIARRYNCVSVFPYPSIVQKHHKSELYLSNVDTWIYYVIHQFIRVCSYVAAMFFAPYIATIQWLACTFFSVAISHPQPLLSSKELNGKNGRIWTLKSGFGVHCVANYTTFL